MIEILLEIMMIFRVTDDDLIGKNRTMPLPEARHRAFGMLYREGYKQAQIAMAFNVTQSAVSRGITNYYQTR